jgi:ribonucleoside-diphosphate reductase alpha chain
MHLVKFPQLTSEIENAYLHVYSGKILPSMRSLQYGGQEIFRHNNKMYNCAFRAINDLTAFGEIMYLLRGGTGVGISVQDFHVATIPKMIVNSSPLNLETRTLNVDDDPEGWAIAIDSVIRQYYTNPRESIVINYDKIQNGQDLESCIESIKNIFDRALLKYNGVMRPIDYHDVVCFIAKACTERAALISLFSTTDKEMVKCKSGEWWKTDPQRSMANNSVMFDRNFTRKCEFDKIWKIISTNKYGEPGFYFGNDLSIGTNPCAEISLKNKQFCNLVEIIVSNVYNQSELEQVAKAAAFIATLQASYTDFHYLSKEWKETTEEDALIGVSMTGIAAYGVFPYNLKATADVVVAENRRVANLINISPCPRCTTIKPAGSTSIVACTASGIHGFHDSFYIRRVRISKKEPLYDWMVAMFPLCIEKNDVVNKNFGVLKFPMTAPHDGILRSESVFDMLERISKFSKEWIRNGKTSGIDSNGISATVSIKDEEWARVGEWMWDNRYSYNGLSILPFSNHEYVQAPFTSSSFEEYYELVEAWANFDLSKVTKLAANFEGQIACGGAGCEI